MRKTGGRETGKAQSQCKSELQAARVRVNFM